MQRLRRGGSLISVLSRVPFHHPKSKKEIKKHKTLVSMQASAPGDNRCQINGADKRG